MTTPDTRTPSARWSARYREKLKQTDPEKYKKLNLDRSEYRRKNRRENPELVKAQRARYNEKRRAKRLTPEAIAAKEQKIAERAARSAETADERKARRAEQDRRRAKERYAKLKALLETNPEAREEYNAKCRAYYAKKRGIFTEEEKARRLQRAREIRVANLRKANAKRSAERLANPEKAERTPEEAKVPVNKTKVGSGRKKPGRLCALMGWRGF